MIIEIVVGSATLLYIRNTLYRRFLDIKKYSTTEPKIFLEESLKNKSEISDAEKTANRNLAISSTSLGLSIIGALFYPFLSLISALGIIYICRYFFESTYLSLKKERRLNIDTLVAINTILFVVQRHFVLGNFTAWLWAFHAKLMNRIKDNSKKDFIDVFEKQPRSVWISVRETEVEIPFHSLKHEDIVVVRAGETIPVDGFIENGMALVDQHILTGESQPVEKEAGDPVFALTVVLSGYVHIKAEKTGNETTSAQIGQILNKTVDFKTDIQLWAERMTEKSVWPTILLSGLSIPILGSTGPLIVLYSNPKYKLLTPASLSILSFFNLSSKNGLLIKDGRTFELLNRVDTIVFDKTGTLTIEQPHVGQIHICSQYTEDEILAYVASAENKQTHPIARAIKQELRTRQVSIPNIEEAEYKVGYGIIARVDDLIVHVGSTRFIETEEIMVPPDIRQIQTACYTEGHSLILVAINKQICGAIELHTSIRPEAAKTIRKLRQRGKIKQTYIISGDHEAPTRSIAEKLGIDHYFSQVLPESKAELIDKLHRQGKSVCFVGDGINDAIALKKATVSISLRGASTVATDTAQIVLMNDNLKNICYLFDLAEEFEKNLKGTFSAVLIPHLSAVGGAFLFNFGLLPVIILSQVGFVLGVGYSLWPLIQYKNGESLKKIPPSSESNENRK
jgi:Cu2+-exporting ATPase